VTSYCNYPPEAQERAQIGGYSAKTISVESIVALEPDLVLAAGETHRPIIEALEPLNVPVVAVDPESIDEVYDAIDLIDYLTGLEGAGGEVSAEMRARIEEVARVAAAIPEGERLTIYWQIWDEPLMTAGPSTFAGQLIELAGGVNLFADLTESYPQVSAEEVVKRNPDVIMGPDSHGDKLTVEQFAQRPGWEDITAVRNGRVHLVNGDIVSRAGPRLADALEAVARALYPERFE
jgi:iron complex transport system substrate-binding protein